MWINTLKEKVNFRYIKNNIRRGTIAKIFFINDLIQRKRETAMLENSLTLISKSQSTRELLEEWRTLFLKEELSLNEKRKLYLIVQRLYDLGIATYY